MKEEDHEEGSEIKSYLIYAKESDQKINPKTDFLTPDCLSDIARRISMNLSDSKGLPTSKYLTNLAS